MLHLFVDTTDLPVAVFLAAAGAVVAYSNWVK